MNLKEIMMTVNSDITKPLNNLINDLSDKEVELLNSIISKLDNTTYGLSALKTLIDGINSDIDNTTYGLSALKTLLDTVNTNAALLKNSTYGLSALKTLIDGINSDIDNTTYGLSALKTLIDTVNTNAAYAKTNNSLLNNSTYGLSALKTLIDGISNSGGSKPFYTSDFIKTITNIPSVSTLPYSFYIGSAVVYNNEIHILGGDNNYTKHYKWDGTSWTSVSTLPYNFYNGSAVVYNNEIHILGSSSSNYTAHKILKYIYIYKSFLPSGVVIYFYDDFPILSITEKINCTKQSDNSILVNSDGLVEFEIVYIEVEEDNIKYAIY